MTASDVLRAATRPVRRARRVLATTDPDRSRLRLASTTVLTVLVVAVVLFTGAGAAGLAVTAVIPGVILGMISSMAVREVRPGPRSLTILLMVPASLASITLASLLSAWPFVVDAVFVAVAVASVFLRVLGPRGVALGMLAFMSYFLAVFVRITPAQLPLVAAAQLVAAGIAIVIRLLLAQRRDDRALRRMIAALGYRAHRVVDALAEGVERGGFDERLRRTVASRLAASSSTAASVQDALESADEPVLEGIGNDELGVRVLDLQLTMERLVEAVEAALDPPDASDVERAALTAGLRRLAHAVDGPVRIRRTGPVGAAPAPSPAPAAPTARLDRIDRILAFGAFTWRGVAWRGSDLTDAERAATTEAPEQEDDTTEAAPLADRLRDLRRVAVQVGLAAALAIAAGTAISSTRWFWAVIAAFVVYVGTSSRGEILTKGWLRVVGTLGGVVVGVVVAALVGGNTVLALALILVCVFAGVYLVSVSSAFMIFFITTMLALLYGLLGEFSIDLLLTRLAETAAGAVIGVGVAYVVLPTSTRDVARDRIRELLDALAEGVTHAVDRMALERTDVGGTPGADEARAVHGAFEAVRTAVAPITNGLAGIASRSGTRRTLQILGVCEYHCRSLLRRADSVPGIAGAPALRTLFHEAAAAVRADIELLASAAGTPIEPHPDGAARLLDALEAQADAAASPDRARLMAAAADLRAIDRAVRDRAGEIGLTPGAQPSSRPARPGSGAVAER